MRVGRLLAFRVDAVALEKNIGDRLAETSARKDFVAGHAATAVVGHEKSDWPVWSAVKLQGPEPPEGTTFLGSSLPVVWSMANAETVPRRLFLFIYRIQIVMAWRQGQETWIRSFRGKTDLFHLARFRLPAIHVDALAGLLGVGADVNSSSLRLLADQDNWLAIGRLASPTMQTRRVNFFMSSSVTRVLCSVAASRITGNRTLVLTATLRRRAIDVAAVAKCLERIFGKSAFASPLSQGGPYIRPEGRPQTFLGLHQSAFTLQFGKLRVVDQAGFRIQFLSGQHGLQHGFQFIFQVVALIDDIGRCGCLRMLRMV